MKKDEKEVAEELEVKATEDNENEVAPTSTGEGSGEGEGESSGSESGNEGGSQTPTTGGDSGNGSNTGRPQGGLGIGGFNPNRP